MGPAVIGLAASTAIHRTNVPTGEYLPPVVVCTNAIEPAATTPTYPIEVMPLEHLPTHYVDAPPTLQDRVRARCVWAGKLGRKAARAAVRRPR